MKKKLCRNCNKIHHLGKRKAGKTVPAPKHFAEGRCPRFEAVA